MSHKSGDSEFSLQDSHSALSRRQVLTLLGSACVAAPLVMSAGNALGQVVHRADSGPQVSTGKFENTQANTTPGDACCAYHFMCV